MQKLIQNLIEDYKNYPDGYAVPCARCWDKKITIGNPLNGTSRYLDIDICPACEQDEAMREHENRPQLRPYQWEAIRRQLRGKTFLDLLRDQARVVDELCCDLVIGGVDMPATLVWDDDSRITSYGAEFYAPLMESPYKILPNGNIEVFCDDHKLGEHFAKAAAGYIGVSEYEKLFEVSPLTSMRIQKETDNEFPNLFDVDDTGITCRLDLTDIDVDERFSINVSQWNVPVLCTITYNPVNGSLECRYSTSQIHGAYPATPEEQKMMAAEMEEVCKLEYGCGMKDLWANRLGSNLGWEDIGYNEGEEPQITTEGITAMFAPLFDTADVFGDTTHDMTSANFYVCFHPESGTLEYVCIVEDLDSGDTDILRVDVQDVDRATVLGALNERCRDEIGLPLYKCWERHKSSITQ